MKLWNDVSQSRERQIYRPKKFKKPDFRVGNVEKQKPTINDVYLKKKSGNEGRKRSENVEFRET